MVGELSMRRKHFKLKRRALIFEGVVSENYKSSRNKWIRLSIVSTFLPLFLGCIISWYNGKFELLYLFGQGEIILSLFSLTVPLMFDLFEVKKNNDERLSRAFFLCTIIVILQIVFYCLIRVDTSSAHDIKGFITSIPFIIASWLCCLYSIKVMAIYADEIVR